MRLRDLAGLAAFVIFVALLVFMMNKISSPNATYELGDYVIITDLVLAFVFIMVPWGTIADGEPLEHVLPFHIPSFVAIPLGVAAFVFLYVSGLGEILLHLNEVESPAFALFVAALILGGATYLSIRSPDPHRDAAIHGDEATHAAGDAEHGVTITSTGGQQH